LRLGYRLREQPTWPFAIFLPMKATLSPDVEATERRFGRLDVTVANAGIGQQVGAPAIKDLTPAMVQRG